MLVCVSLERTKLHLPQVQSSFAMVVDRTAPAIHYRPLATNWRQYPDRLLMLALMRPPLPLRLPPRWTPNLELHRCRPQYSRRRSQWMGQQQWRWLALCCLTIWRRLNTLRLLWSAARHPLPVALPIAPASRVVRATIAAAIDVAAVHACSSPWPSWMLGGHSAYRHNYMEELIPGQVQMDETMHDRSRSISKAKETLLADWLKL